MKRLSVFFVVLFFGWGAISNTQAQFIQENAYQLPIIAGEVTFIQNDTATALYADDFYPIAKAWVSQNYPETKFAKDGQKDQKADDQLEVRIHFKIDDQHMQAPLYYQGTLHLKWKDQIIQIKLDRLSYTTGQPKGKAAKSTGITDVSFQVKQQVRSGADKLYPHTWDSLNDYGQAMLHDFSAYIQTSAGDIL